MQHRQPSLPGYDSGKKVVVNLHACRAPGIGS